MDNDTHISTTDTIFLIVIAFITGASWSFIWATDWPPSFFHLLGAVLGIIPAVIMCIDRLINFDIIAWDWRNSERDKSFAPLLSKIIPFSGVTGTIIYTILQRTAPSDVNDMIFTACLAYPCVISIWMTIEHARHVALR
jgi:hypothetical protein